jgi:hypothetical protein
MKRQRRLSPLRAVRARCHAGALDALLENELVRRRSRGAAESAGEVEAVTAELRTG